jgi:hypothetical protein
MHGIWTGSERASLDWTSAGIFKSPSRFLAWFACSVLGISDWSRVRQEGNLHRAEIHDGFDTLILQAFSIC